MRTLLTAVAVCSLLSLTACQNTGHKGHDHAAGEQCCTTTGTCCTTDAKAQCATGTCCTTDAKAQCATCTAVGKDNCTTCTK